MSTTNPSLFLLNPTGSGGDVYPYIPVGVELKRRGHDVRVLSSPFYRQLVESQGLRFVDIGRKRDMQRVSEFVNLNEGRNAWRAALRWGAVSTMRQTYEKIMRFCQAEAGKGGLAIVTSPLGFGARIAAEKHAIPMATLVLSPYVLRTVRDSPRIDPLWLGSWIPGPLKRLQYAMADRLAIDPVVSRQTNRFRRDLGMPPVQRFMHQWNLSPDRIIGLFPSTLCDPQADFPAQTELVGPVLWIPQERTLQNDSGQSGRIEQAFAFAEECEPPILILSGSVGLHDRDSLRKLLQLCRHAGQRAILVERNHFNVPESLPAGVAHFDFLPVEQILPKCSAIIHSGGIGTVNQSLAAGVPQLIVPGVNDQSDNARRVQRMGAGLILDRKVVSDQITCGLLKKVTQDQSLRAECQKLANETGRVDSVNRTCDLLEELLPGIATR